MNQPINFFSNLDNNINEYPTLDECTQAVKELISKEIYNNHLNLLAENGIYCHSLREVDNDVQILFLNKYVDHGVHGYFSSKLDKVIREQLPRLHQYLQTIGNAYIVIRHNQLWSY